MRKKLAGIFLALAIMVPIATTPIMAVTDVVHPDFNRDKVREIVVGQTSDVAGLITGVIPVDTIKDLAKTAISGMLNFDDIGNLAGPALGGLLEGTISDSLGITLPGSIDIGGIINDILTNEYVNAILTSDFVGTVIDKTIDNLIDALVVEDVIGVLTDSVVDRLTDEIWNNGDPSSSNFLGLQTGHWNTTGGWNTTNIGISIALKLGISGLSGNIEDYIDYSNIDFTRIFSIDTIFAALTQAVTDTATEYWEAYKPILAANIQAKINEIKDNIQAELINGLNKIFELKLSLIEELDAIEAKIMAHICDAKDCLADNKDEIISGLKDLKKIVNKLDKYSCLDLSKVNALLDKLIKCLEDEEDVPPIVDPVLVSVEPFAVVEKLSGNKNNLTITIVGTYSDGSTKIIAEQVFSIDNNAADTYVVGDYNVYVDTKGNEQIRDCYLV